MKMNAKDREMMMLVTDAVASAVKKLLPGMIQKELRALGIEIRAVIPGQEREHAGSSDDPTQEDLLAMSARARADIERRHGPETVRQLDRMAADLVSRRALPPATAINRATIERLREEGQALARGASKRELRVRAPMTTTRVRPNGRD